MSPVYHVFSSPICYVSTHVLVFLDSFQTTSNQVWHFSTENSCDIFAITYLQSANIALTLLYMPLFQCPGAVLASSANA